MNESAPPHDAISLDQLHRVLVAKLAHLGDVLLASPVVSALRRHLPAAEIDALVYADTAPMLSGHPDLAQLFVLDRRKASVLQRVHMELDLLRNLRARRYDLIVYLSDKPRGAWLARLTGTRYAVTGEKRSRPGLWRRSFTHFYPIPRGNTRHTVEVHLDALRRIGIYPQADERRVTLVPGAAAEQAIERRLDAHGLAPRGFVHIHPTSRWLFKCWPMAQLAQLINILNERCERVVITASPDAPEMAMIEALTHRLDKPVINLAGQLSLKELAALIARARIFLGVDSVPMHIASAMGTPVVALFGPSGEIEWGPWQTAHRIVTSNHSCRPCGINGCGGSNRSECMEVLAVERVLAAFDALLRETRGNGAASRVVKLSA